MPVRRFTREPESCLRRLRLRWFVTLSPFAVHRDVPYVAAGPLAYTRGTDDRAVSLQPRAFSCQLLDPRGAGGLNTGKAFAIRVTLSGSLVNGVTVVGSQWWANAPDADCIAIVGPTRPVTPPNWDACPALHLAGCPIIPTSFYDIVVMNGIAVSDPPLAAATQALPADGKWWGDAVGNFTGDEGPPPNVWTPPQGVTNFDDVNASLKTFIDPGAANATHTSVTDIHPNRPDLGGNSVHPNRLVSIDDVFQFIQAFQGAEYPGAAIDLCPDP